MSLRVRVSPEAEVDLFEVYAWYEEAQPGLGTLFLDSVETALHYVAQNPLAGREVHDEIRRVLTHRFPYGLTYTIKEDAIFVLGCFHLRRDPTLWRSRSPRPPDA